MRIFRLGALVAALIAILYYVGDELNNDRVPLPVGQVEAVTGPDNWGLAGGDIQHMAWVAQDLAVPGEQLWKFQTEDGLKANPVVADGVVYQATLDAQVVALNASDGQLLWEYATIGPVDISPAVTQDAVYVGFRNGTFVALRREDGSLLWTYKASASVSASPVVAKGVVYAGLGNGLVVALDAQTGEELWAFRAGRGGGSKEGHLGEWITGSPVIRGDVLAVSSLNGSVHFVDTRTGLRRLRYDAVSPILNNIAYAGDRLVLATQLGHLLVLDSTKIDYPPEERLRIWRKQWFHWGLQAEPPVPKSFLWGIQRLVGLNSPAVTDDTVYVVADDGRLHSYDAATGRALWTYHPGTPSDDGSPLIVGDAIYYGTNAGDIHVVDRQLGTARAIFHVGGPITGMPVMANGTLFVTSKDGALYAWK